MEEAKPATEPSAEELLAEILGYRDNSRYWKKAIDRLKADRAAQHQAGREEALDIYNDSLVVMDIRHAELITCYARLEEAAKCVQREKSECSEVSIQAWDALDEALSDLASYKEATK